MTTNIEGTDDHLVGGILAQTILNLMQQGPKLDGLPMWVIYEKPRDYPSNFVARLHIAHEGMTKPIFNRCVVSNDIRPLRIAFERLGLVRIVRSPEDDPVIVETWL